MLKSNAIRFIDAYNTIDNAMRMQYSLHPNTNYSDAVRRCAPLNSIIRQYENELIDYGRLRNAIVHRSFGEVVIAEPHNDVVEKFEKISRLVATPPKASTIYNGNKREVITVSISQNIRSVIELMSKTEYSHMPVLDKDNTLIGVVSNKRIINAMGRVIKKGTNLHDFVENTEVGLILNVADMGKYYMILSEEATLEEVMQAFETNRRLLAILLTKSGTNADRPMTIITIADILEITNILDNY